MHAPQVSTYAGDTAFLEALERQRSRWQATPDAPSALLMSADAVVAAAAASPDAAGEGSDQAEASQGRADAQAADHAPDGAPFDPLASSYWYAGPGGQLPSSGVSAAAYAHAHATLANDPTEHMLDEWLYRARMRAYASSGPLADDPWAAHNSAAASSALVSGLQQVFAM